MTRNIKDFVQVKSDEGTARINQYPVIDRLDSLKDAFEKFTKQPAIKEAIANHKSNWMANSKGGEPNHRP